MLSDFLIFPIPAHSLALWLELRLMTRNWANPRLRYAGLGLFLYALTLGLDLLAAVAPSPTVGQFLARLQWPLLFLPAIFWFGATVHLLPEETPWQHCLNRSWGYGLLPQAGPFYLVGVGSHLIFDFRSDPPPSGPVYSLLPGRSFS